MTLFHLVLVAIIQGITEFLPVSSSGHLILLPELTGMQDQGLVIDVAVHVEADDEEAGLAVVLEGRREVGRLRHGYAGGGSGARLPRRGGHPDGPSLGNDDAVAAERGQ